MFRAADWSEGVRVVGPNKRGSMSELKLVARPQANVAIDQTTTPQNITSLRENLSVAQPNGIAKMA